MAEGEGGANLVAKTLVLTGHGGYDKMMVVAKPRPKAGKGEVVVNVRAVGLNFAELMMRQGLYNRCPKTPCVIGYEGAGVVVEVGEGVNTLKVDDRVMCLKNFGMWSEYVSISADQAFLIPDKMEFEEAAAIPVNYITAYHCLFDFGNLRKGNSVLVHMAAGGVGIAATQLCKTVEDTVVFGTASAGKHDVIREQGCTHPIDYRTQDYVQEIRKINPKGVDIVMDPLGGQDASKGFNLLRPMGRIIHYGLANAVTGASRNLIQVAKAWWATKSVSPFSLMPQNKGVFGYHAGYLVDEKEVMRSAALDLLELYKQGKIKPKIDSVWAFEDVGKAMAQMHDRKNIGKVIMSPQKEPVQDSGAARGEKGEGEKK